MFALDTGALLSALVVLLVAVFAYYHTRQYWPAWEQKEGKEERFGRLAGQWPLLYQVSGAVAVFVTFFTYVHMAPLGVGVQSYASLVVGIITFFMVFMGWTDLYTMKAPREMAAVCLWFIIPLGLTGVILGQYALPNQEFISFFYQNPYLDHWVQFIAYLFVLALIHMFVPSNQLGDGDVKALWIVGFGLEPLVGFIPAAYFWGFAAVIQVLSLFIFAPLFGWGKVVHDPMKKSRMAINRLVSRLFRTKRELIPAYNSRATPLLPAIGLASVAGTLLLTGFTLVI